MTSKDAKLQERKSQQNATKNEKKQECSKSLELSRDEVMNKTLKSENKMRNDEFLRRQCKLSSKIKCRKNVT